jgi:hypothetical protein
MTESPRVALQAAATVFVVKDVTKSVAQALIHLQAATDSERQPGQAAVYIFVTTWTSSTTN